MLHRLRDEPKSRYIYCKTFWTILISDKECPEIKPSEIFKRPTFLRYSKTTLVSPNKPDIIRIERAWKWLTCDLAFFFFFDDDDERKETKIYRGEEA